MKKSKNPEYIECLHKNYIHIVIEQVEPYWFQWITDKLSFIKSCYSQRSTSFRDSRYHTKVRLPTHSTHKKCLGSPPLGLGALITHKSCAVRAQWFSYTLRSARLVSTLIRQCALLLDEAGSGQPVSYNIVFCMHFNRYNDVYFTYLRI